MDGVVGPPVINANPTRGAATVTWALPGTNTGTQFDVRYRVGTAGA